MKTCSIPLSLTRIGRVVFVRCTGEPPSPHDLGEPASVWLDDFAPKPLAERAVGWTERHPLQIGVFPNDQPLELNPFDEAHAGAEELAGMRQATHLIEVQGVTDASGEGWLAVDSYARGVARAFGGVIVDCKTMAVRPLDERTMPLAEVTPTEVCRTYSLPTGANRWAFFTAGLINVGLPEVYFDDVPGTRVAEAVTVIQGLRDALMARAAERWRGGARTRFVPGRLDIPEVGQVAVQMVEDPFIGVPILQAYSVTRPRVPLGRLLGRRPRPSDSFCPAPRIP